jgi:hypothetical protein
MGRRMRCSLVCGARPRCCGTAYDGFWSVTGYADEAEILNDWRTDLEAVDEAGERYHFHGVALGMSRVLSWPNIAFRDSESPGLPHLKLLVLTACGRSTPHH